MFEKALVVRAGHEEIDIGLVAETTFFYGTTQLLLNRGSVCALVSQIPEHQLIGLFDRNAIQLSYLREAFSVHTSGIPQVHDLGAVQLYSTGVGEKKLNYRDEIELALERERGKSAGTRRLARMIGDRVKLHRLRFEEPNESIPDLARRDLRDATFVKQAIVAVLNRLVPSYKLPQFHFRLLNVEAGGYVVDTNLDFDAINRVYHRNIPVSHSSISPAYLLVHILDARADLFFAAYYMAELVTAQVYSDIIGIKHFDFLMRRQQNVKEADQFIELSLPDFPTIREAINSGERTFAEFLVLLDKAEKFKKWIQKTNPDAGLVQEYHKAVTAETWADKLPSKGVRFAVATGIGLAAELIAPSGIALASGIGAGAFDTFILDRLLKGWRPNQFIEGPYKKFVQGDAKRR